MTDRYQHLMHLDPRALHNYLAKRGDPPLVRQAIFDVVTAQQKRRANKSRRNAQLLRWWEPIAAPLTHEIKVVRAMQKHDIDNAQRQEVLSAYMAVLMRVRMEINLAKFHQLTPKGWQSRRVESGKPPYPNGLSNWTDLVPEKVRQQIEQAFDALPYKAKAKRKIPFELD